MEKPIILIAEDDLEDQMLIREAFEENNFTGILNFCSHGEEVLDYLHNRGQFADTTLYLRPSLILMDLNMPKKDGRETLKETKCLPGIKNIPVVIFTTSSNDNDICTCYDLGANSYLCKPFTFPDMVQVTETLIRYWLELTQAPLIC